MADSRLHLGHGLESADINLIGSGLVIWTSLRPSLSVVSLLLPPGSSAVSHVLRPPGSRCKPGMGATEMREMLSLLEGGSQMVQASRMKQSPAGREHTRWPCPTMLPPPPTSSPKLLEFFLSAWHLFPHYAFSWLWVCLAFLLERAGRAFGAGALVDSQLALAECAAGLYMLNWFKRAWSYLEGLASCDGWGSGSRRRGGGELGEGCAQLLRLDLIGIN